MNARRLTAAAWIVCAVSAVGTLVLLAVGLGQSTPGDTFVIGGWGGFSFAFASMAFATMGALVGARLPDNRVGWVFCITGLALGLGTVTYHYADQVLYGSAKGLPGGTVAALLQNLGVPPTFGLLALALMLFPDGHLPSRRWWPGVVPSLAGAAFVVIGYGLRPGPYDVPFETEVNPLGVGGAFVFMDLLSVFGWPLMGLGLLLAAAAMRARLKRAKGLERQQLKWVTFAAAVAGVMILADIASFFLDIGESNQLRIAALGIGFSVVPLAAGVAILRYRLYDIDIVINKAVVFVVLVGFITVVYAAIVVGLGRLLPIGEGNLVLAVVATAVVAVAFEPVRARVQHWANRLVYGQRATPYETLAAMTASIGEAADPGDALGEAARLLAEGTGAAQAVVWVARDGVLTPRATAGDVADEPAPVALVGGDLPAMGGAGLSGAVLVEPVRHEGKLVGALSLAKRAGEGVNTTDRRLVEELAGQAALLLANTRLRSRLGDRLVELRVSRQRMITAQDQARHALERDLHDGAQQELVALKVKLGLARTIATREGDTETAEQLAATVAIADRAVDTLRDVARGIYPPLLESEGLAAALSAQARRADLAVTVLDRAGTRYPRELEATAYFCDLEALRNAVKHANADNAHIELNGNHTHLVVTITDDGDGYDPDHTPHGDGLTHMADRIDATGGTLDITTQPGHGTTITLNLPVA